MNDKSLTCENDGCFNEFVKVTHNQKYCSDECCREATNAKIKKKNADKKDRLSGRKRVCSTKGCDTVLSRYSESNICLLCEALNAKRELNNLLDMIKNVSG